MATSPFIQQITNIVSAEVIVGGTSTASRIVYPNLEFTPGFLNSLAYDGVPDIVAASIYRGLYFSGNLTDAFTRNTLQIRPNCPTENCTFDEFDSLAVCSACANVTDLLIPQSHHVDNSSRIWSWALPNGFSTLEGGIYMSGHWMSDLVVSTAGAYDPLRLQAGLPIVNITAIQPCVDANGEPCAATAQECMLHWCVNRYRATIAQGILYEDVIDTIKYGQTIHPDWLENDTYVFHTNYSSPMTSRTAVLPAVLGSEILYNSSTTLTVSKWGSASLTDLLANLLTLNLTFAGLYGNIAAFDAAAEGYSTFPGIPLDMTTVFEAIALSMTSAVRSDLFDKAGLSVVPGQVTKDVPVMRVRWAWITLPAVLQAGALVLLCHVCYNARRYKVPVWKNSVLASILLGARVHELLDRASPALEGLVELKVVAEDVVIGPRQIYLNG